MQVSLRLAVLAAITILTGPGFAQGVIPGQTPARDVAMLDATGFQSALDTLPDIVDDIMEQSGVPGMAVGVVQGDRTVFLEGFGVREIGTDLAVTPETVFQIASISKSISATVAAIAITRGGVKWDDPVVQHLPGFTLFEAHVGETVTIGDMFAHRSGLPYAAGDALEDLGYDRDEIISRLKLLPLDDFRTSYHYANFGITTGAEAIAAALDEPWEELTAELLFRPLGMDATSSRHADFLNHPQRATLHTFDEGRFEALFARDPDQQSPAGGVSSSARDMTYWLKLLLANGDANGETLFDMDAMAPALRPQVVSAPANVPEARSGFYGYGFNVGVSASGRPTMSHSGAFLLGAATHFQILPTDDIGIIVLSNGAPVGAVEAVAAHFLDVFQFGAPTRDWLAAYGGVMKALYEPVGDLAGARRSENAEPFGELDSLVGRYQNAYFGSANVKATDQGLVIELEPEGATFQLEHWSNTIFALTPRGENAPPGSRSSVAFDVEGGQFVIDYLNEDGLGTWTRATP